MSWLCPWEGRRTTVPATSAAWVGVMFEAACLSEYAKGRYLGCTFARWSYRGVARIRQGKKKLHKNRGCNGYGKEINEFHL